MADALAKMALLAQRVMFLAKIHTKLKVWKHQEMVSVYLSQITFEIISQRQANNIGSETS
jgi:hypothetical protein